MKKSILITGATGGIGQAIAFSFAKQGYDLLIHYHQQEHTALNLAKKLLGYGIDAYTIKADISQPEQVDSMMKQARQHLGKIDVLVNNAGIALQKLYTDTTQQEFKEVIGINLLGVLYCSQAVLPDMIIRKQGKIINISSMWGVIGASCEVVYSASKAGVIGFTKALAKEVSPSGIYVNCVAPGVIETNMNRTLSLETKELLRQDTPLQTLGTVQDVAQAVLFLASDQARFITGEVLNVNGGFIMA